MTAAPLALYVHFPWCVKKCPYCDFNSHAQTSAIDEQGYIDALLSDLAGDIETYGGRRITSIFLGGGTPSLFSGAAIVQLLRGIEAQLDFAVDIEITMEANPGAVEHDDFAAYREAGVNRLSLGAQSFEDAQLRRLGRVHNAAESKRSIGAALDAGLVNLNLDLMHGLPRQTRQAALRDLEIALEFAPSHISLYQLAIEPNTWFHRHPPKLPAESRLMAIQQGLHALADKRGYRRYEVSAYARPGKQCQHNLNYWQFGDYLGIGAGAHGKITRDGRITRYWKQRHPTRYLATAASAARVGGGAEIAAGDAVFELLMNALRLTKGFDAELIPQRTGRRIDEAHALLATSVKQGLVETGGGRIRCSEQGYWFLDEILQRALPTPRAWSDDGDNQSQPAGR